MTIVSPTVEPIKVLAKILQDEMGIPDGNIMLGLENWRIPETADLYIALLYGSDTVISNTNQNSLTETGDYSEVQSAVMLHQIDIDVMSFDSSARTRKEQVLWAIQSYNAEVAMEKYKMRLAMTPSVFVPVPSLEEAKQLNRFRISIMINALHENVKTTPYYDSLQPVELVENP